MKKSLNNRLLFITATLLIFIINVFPDALAESFNPSRHFKITAVKCATIEKTIQGKKKFYVTGSPQVVVTQNGKTFLIEDPALACQALSAKSLITTTPEGYYTLSKDDYITFASSGGKVGSAAEEEINKLKRSQEPSGTGLLGQEIEPITGVGISGSGKETKTESVADVLRDQKWEPTRYDQSPPEFDGPVDNEWLSNSLP